jgi:hypothetical protein
MGEKTPDVQAYPRILVETLRSVVLISGQPTMIGILGRGSARRASVAMVHDNRTDKRRECFDPISVRRD